MQIVLSLTAAIVAGGAYGWCFPPHSIQLLAWVVLVPFFLAVRLGSPCTAALAGIAFGVAGQCATVDWLPAAVQTYFDQSLAVGWALFCAIAAFMVVPHITACAVACNVLGRAYSSLFPLLAGTAWVAAEYARSQLLTGNPWALLGYSQIGVDVVVQIADVTGVYGVSFVLAAANAALAEACVAYRVRHDLRRRLTRPLAVAAAIVGLTLAYGQTRLSTLTAVPLAVAVPTQIVQGNLDLGSQWRAAFYGENLDTYLRLTISGLRDANARLVVWPENAMSFFLADEPLYQEAIGRALLPFDAELLAGGPHVERPPERFFNSAFVIAPSGRVTARYDKQYLLPFGEYFPFPRADFLRRSFGRVREFTPGPPAAPLATVHGSAGVLICNEVLFPDIARARALAGATYLVNLSNDTWVNDRKFSAIAFDMSIMRAVEQRRYLIRASTSGPSGIVDHLGRVVAVSDQFTREVVSGTVHANSELTMYARLGDVLPIACILVVVLVLITTHRVSV